MECPYTATPICIYDREIRLVRLEQSDADEAIKCSLQAAIVDYKCPNYIAISYTWGSKGRYDHIQLNGTRFPVRRNLWHFLNQMRSRQRYSLFWIDAICIDQDDVEEQNHQVGMMREIYSGAQAVWVWLGTEDKIMNSNMAMRYLETRQPLDANAHPKKLCGPKKAAAMLELCERAYWKRIWIVQEIVLAREISILCGDRQVSWSKLQKLMEDLQSIMDRG
jgi:hypothetical protein